MFERFKKIKLTIANNDIIIGENSSHVCVRDIIKRLNYAFRYISINEVRKDEYLGEENIYLTRSNVKIKNGEYTWSFDQKYFDFDYIKCMWEYAFKNVSRWEHDTNVDIKMYIEYPNGKRMDLKIISRKTVTYSETDGFTYNYNYNWEE